MTDMERLRPEELQDAQSKAVGLFREIETAGFFDEDWRLSLRDSEHLAEEMRK